MITQSIMVISIGYILDLFIGDPYSLPHPIKFFGRSISFFEKKLNNGQQKKIKGALMSLSLIISTLIAFYFLKSLISFNYYVDVIISAVVIFYGLANRMLVNEVLKVNRVLSHEGLEAGRKQLSFIVGRQTDKLDEQAIRTASLETLAENLSDGVIAPLFYLFLGGFPLMMTYKMVNTLDSMIGYKNERYLQFGFFAAKIDDIFNFIPARITAVLIAAVSIKAKSFQYIFKYGHQHSSPNAGYPEAAMAGALDCRFGGPSEYHGKVVSKPYIGQNNRTITPKIVNTACGINIKSSFLFLGLGLALYYLILN